MHLSNVKNTMRKSEGFLEILTYHSMMRAQRTQHRRALCAPWDGPRGSRESLELISRWNDVTVIVHIGSNCDIILIKTAATGARAVVKVSPDTVSSE